ncbi:hypothetical protein MI170_00850 [Mycolicibacterium goodii]|uniref:hypothetical protein n=1 Tax=Mycolicibacterium goodii TaxID=134601 RepID=UPI001F047B33|nr:hypothetical protein [Mycolicibacterium goodii]ULN47973.1 hypothetical protein MI170_00850 [Mycolicibacterium goodii]
MTGRPIAAAYIEALKEPCPTCAAEPGDHCTVTDEQRGTRLRRVRCVRRCPPSLPVEEDPAPRAPARSFSEPIHQLDSDEEQR